MTPLEQILFDSASLVSNVRDASYQILTLDETSDIQYEGNTIPSIAKRVNDFLQQKVANGDFDGLDGLGLSSASINTSNELVLALTDGTEFNLGVVIGTDGVGLDNVEIIGTSLVFTLSDGTTLNVGTVKGTDGVSIANVYISGTDILVDLTDGSTINAGDISQFGGKSVTNAAISSGGALILTFNDGTTANAGQVVGAKGVNGLSIVTAFIDASGSLKILMSDGKTINAGKAQITTIDGTSVQVSDINIQGEDLLVTLTDDRVITVPGVKGVDAIGVNDAAIDANGDLIITLSDSSTINAGNVTKTIISGLDISIANAVINESGELLLSVFNGVDTTEYNVGIVNGTDGIGITSASIDTNNHLIFTMSDSSTIDAGELNSNSITGIVVNASGQLEFSLTDGTTITTDVVTGTDGTSITGASLDNDGHLIITTDAGSTIDAGLVVRAVETNFEIVGNDLVVTYSDGSQQTFNGITGTDGVYPVQVELQNDELIITMSDASVVNAGKLGNTPQSVEIDDDGFLIITTFTGTTFSAGNVKGADGRNIDNIRKSGTNLIFDLSDGQSITITDVIGVNGVGVESISFSGTELNFEMSDGSVFSVSSIRGEDGINVSDVSYGSNNELIFTMSNGTVYTVPNVKGVDGTTIESIEYDGNDLNINVSDGTVVSIPSVHGIDGNNIDSITFDEATESLNIETSDGLTATFPTVHGRDADQIDSASVASNGDLTFTLVSGGVIAAGNIGKSVDQIQIVSGDLVIDYTDGTQDNLGNVVAIDGIDVVGASIDGDNHLIFELSNSTTVDVGEISRVELSTVVINDDGDLILTFSDSTELNAGRARGVDGVSVQSASINANDELIILLTNNATLNAGVARGADGTSIKNVSVFANGDLIITYSDDTTESAGNIGSGAGLVQFDQQVADDVGYQSDQVVIYQGAVYIANTNTSGTPGVSSDWDRFLVGSMIPDVRRPVLIRPISGDQSQSKRPSLQASAYAPIVDSDAREYREFQVSSVNDFSTIVTSSNVNSDQWTVDTDLNETETYYWRCRDKNSVSEYISEWSNVESFVVPTDYIETPVVSYSGSLTSVERVPLFETTPFNVVVGSDTHQSTDWVVTDLGGNIVFQSLNDTENLLSIVVPLLDASTDYNITARHNGQVLSSLYSVELGFTTVATAPTITTPTIQLSNGTNTSGKNPSLISTVLDTSEANVSHVSSDWEVYDSVGTLVFKSYSNESNLYQINVDTVDLTEGTTYTARVRYHTDYLGDSDWSSEISFTVTFSINQPTITTEESVESFPSNGVFLGSTFDGVNEIHIASQWQLISSVNGVTLFDSGKDSFNLTSITDVVPYGHEDEDVQIRVKYFGRYTESVWSEYLLVHTGSTRQKGIEIVSSSSETILSSDGGVLESSPQGISYAIHEESDGSVVVLTTNSITKYRATGAILWSVVHGLGLNSGDYHSVDGTMYGYSSVSRLFYVFSLSDGSILDSFSYSNSIISWLLWSEQNKIVFFESNSPSIKTLDTTTGAVATLWSGARIYITQIGLVQNNSRIIYSTRGDTSVIKASVGTVSSTGSAVSIRGLSDYNTPLNFWYSVNDTVYINTGNDAGTLLKAYVWDGSTYTAGTDVTIPVQPRNGYGIDIDGSVVGIRNTNSFVVVDLSNGQIVGQRSTTGTIYSYDVNKNDSVAYIGDSASVTKIETPTATSVMNLYAEISAVSYDSQGSKYVAFGNSGGYNLVKYDFTGAISWTNSAHPNAIVFIDTDDSGNVLTTCIDGNVRMVNSTGSQVWSYNGGIYLDGTDASSIFTGTKVIAHKSNGFSILSKSNGSVQSSFTTFSVGRIIKVTDNVIGVVRRSGTYGLYLYNINTLSVIDNTSTVSQPMNDAASVMIQDGVYRIATLLTTGVELYIYDITSGFISSEKSIAGLSSNLLSVEMKDGYLYAASSSTTHKIDVSDASIIWNYTGGVRDVYLLTLT